MGAQDTLQNVAGDNSGLELRIKKVVIESGRADGLVRGILSSVAGQAYDSAIRELKSYVAMKSEYPDFEPFTARYVERSAELMERIEEQRNIPGVENLSMAKRQVINDGIVSNVESLRDILKKVETIEYNQRMTDLRSTLIVVKTFAWCVLAVIILAFSMEVYNGLLSTTGSVADEMIGEAVDWTFDKIGM